MTAIRTYEVLSSWIESSKTLDHLMCVDQYIDKIFEKQFAKQLNPLHGELLDSLKGKIEMKETELGINEYIRLFCRNYYLEFIEWIDVEQKIASFHNGDEMVYYKLEDIYESLKKEGLCS